MKTTTTLSCKFKDSLGKARSINIDAPTEPVEESAVQAFMDSVLALDILVVDSNNSDVKLETISSAALTTKIVEDIIEVK